MSRILLYGICVAIFLSPQICVGQFYQYKNAAGILIFTDDLSQVPVEQRPKMQSYDLVEKEEQETGIDKANDAAPDLVDTRIGTENRNWYKEEENRLNREKNALLTLKKNINTPKKQEDYNKRVRALNQQIETFKIKLEQFNKGLTP